MWAGLVPACVEGAERPATLNGNKLRPFALCTATLCRKDCRVIGVGEIEELMVEYQELAAKRNPGTCTGAKPVWDEERERRQPNTSNPRPHSSAAWSWSQFGFGSFSG